MHPHDSDDDLLARLRGIAAEVEPVPDAVRRAARAALATRDLDGQLARLVADSSATSGGLAYQVVREADPVDDRFLTFDGGGLRIELEVTDSADGRTLVGQVVGGRLAECVLEHGDGHRELLPLDPLGRFLLSRLPTGPVRLRCRSLAGPPVTTSWVNL